MEYKKLCELYNTLESTTKRLEKTAILADFLSGLKDKNAENIILLLQGRVFPLWDKSTLGISSNLVIKVLQNVTGKSKKEIETLWKKFGDLGDVAEQLCQKKSQKTLVSSSLTAENVFNNLQKISELEGKGTVEKKLSLIAELLAHSSGIEAKYIIRTILEDLRVGTGEGVVREAIVWSCFPRVKDINDEGKNYSNALKLEEFDEKKIKEIDIKKYDLIESNEPRELYKYFVELVQSAYNVQNDFGALFKILREKGLEGLSDVKITLFHPLKCMLYQKADGVDDGFERVGRPAALEYKYDGFRLQMVKQKNKIALFTRRFEDVTAQFQDVVEYVKDNITGDNFIMEAEAVGYDPKTHNYLPFQKISQRIKRKYNIKELAEKFPVKINVFDCMYMNGMSVIDRPFKERREIIENNINKNPHITPSEILVTDDNKKAEEFYQKSLKSGNEGIMMKNLSAIYKPGSRVGFGVKIKPIMETLDLVILEAEWGEGKRKGWLSSFTLGCKDGDNFSVVGKVSTGVKEKEEEGEELTYKEFTERLKPLIIKESGKTVAVKPKVIIEVAYEEIQKSPSYSSGYALRFPRVIRFRDDKSIDEVSSLSMIKKFYNEQK